MSEIKKCIIEIHKESFENIEVVLGYGMEGNIIGSSLLDYWIEKKVKYHSYPSVHKSDEHLKVEKALWNNYGDFQKVLLLCDIMPTQEYLDEIIKSNEKLMKCTDFYVLSLFCNKYLLKDDVDAIRQTTTNIHRYSLAEVNVKICELDEKDCIVCKENLNKIYFL